MYLPPISEVTSEMKYVPQGSCRFTDARSEKSILVTTGLFTCTGFFGYDSKLKIGFLGHYSDIDDVSRSLSVLVYQLRNTYGSLDLKFDTYFANPTIPAMQIRDLLSCENKFAGLFNFPVDVGSISVGQLQKGQPGPGIGIDTKNGQIFIFAPKRPV